MTTESKVTEVKHIQLIWTDLSNITRCRMFTKELLESTFKISGITICNCILSFPFMLDHTLEPSVGHAVYFPDPRSLPLPLPWLKGVAVTFGNFHKDGNPWQYCPRTFLAQQEKKLEKFEMKMAVGFELEFYLLKQDGTPVDSTVYGETKAFQGKTWLVISKIIAAMKELCIPIWQYHPESGQGQFEISIGPFMGSMIEAADSLVLARQAVYNVASQHEMQATFVPKPFPAFIGSSCHTHISLTNASNENVFETLPKVGTSFVAGIFENLPNMMAVVAPTGNSYDRLQPLTWSGAFQCIGTENKEAAIRLIRNSNGLIDRIELKTPDGTSNPYLMLGSFIGAGVFGIEKGFTLPPEVNVEPTSLPKENQPPRLPTSLAKAIELFSCSDFNVELYGEELRNLIVKLRNSEEEFWTSSESLANKLKVLIQRY